MWVLLQGFAVRELHISEDEMELRLRQLAVLLPGLAAKISVMKPKVRPFRGNKTKLPCFAHHQFLLWAIICTENLHALTCSPAVCRQWRTLPQTPIGWRLALWR